MSISPAHADAFYTEAVGHGEVWTLEDDDGIAAPSGADGRRAMPFWSTRSRAERVVAGVGAYAGFRPRAIALDDFEAHWLPGLAGDGLLVGLNWSGDRATGHDVEPGAVLARLARAR